MSFQKILVAIDNSPLGSTVFAAALELAELYKGALKLLHCITPEVVAEPGLSLSLDTAFPASLMGNEYQAYETQQVLMETSMKEAQEILKRYTDEAMSHGVPTGAECQVGEAGRLLCEEAKIWGADLIVVGRRGRTGLAEAFLGSVSNYVVHHAPCAVLVIQDVEPESLHQEVGELSETGTRIPSQEFLAQSDTDPTPRPEQR